MFVVVYGCFWMFVGVCGGQWWFLVVCGGLWVFVVVYNDEGVAFLPSNPITKVHL